MLTDTKTPAPALVTGTDPRPKAVVIGSGFGGLAAAIRLGAKGYHVTVLERLDAPGGRAYVHKQDGFKFDAGPTIITAPHLLEELWELCGKKLSDDVELRLMEPFYRLIFDDGSTFATNGDADFMREEVGRISPGDVLGYERFVKESERIYEEAFEKLSHEPFGSIMDMVKIAPILAALRADRSVYDHVSKHIKDERLRIALSFHPLFVGGNPLNATCFYALITYLERKHGVWFAMGGTGALVDGMVGLIEGQGGTVRYNVTVDEVLSQSGAAVGVRLEDGSIIPADIVVSNAEAAHTYSHLLRNVKRRRWTDAKLKRASYSMSLIVWYFGTDKRYEEVDHHTVLLGPRYKGLLTDIFKAKELAEDFSLYLHRPTATDPSLAPDGCDAFYVLSPVPHLDADVDWSTKAEPYRQAIEDRLSETILPDLGKHVVSSHLTTPLDFRDRLLSWKGAAFGLEPLLLQSGWFRPNNRSEELDRFFMVGAGSHPGAGIPGVLSSAKVVDKVSPHASAFA